MAPALCASNYEDFVIVVRRMNASTVGARVEASTAGRMAKSVKIKRIEEQRGYKEYN
jgi:hypothetical protein